MFSLAAALLQASWRSMLTAGFGFVGPRQQVSLNIVGVSQLQLQGSFGGVHL